MQIAFPRNFSLREQIQRTTTWIAVPIILYIAVFTIFTVERYERYNATAWDLGIFTQLTWNAAHGRPLLNTLAEQDNMLAVHSPYITVILAPLFWLWADPRMLLIVQTILLGIGAWPVARLAQRHFTQRWIPPLFAVLWLLYPALGFLNRWDFHEIAPAAVFFAFAFDAADRRAWPRVDLWLTLAILCKEEIGLNVAFFGLFMMLKFKRRRLPCLIWFVGGIAFFVIHAFVIFPLLNGLSNGLPIHAVRYEWLLGGNLTTIVDHVFGPDTLNKLAFLVKIFAPVAFISILEPSALLVAVPTFALSFLSNFLAQYDIFLHYTAVIIPSVLVSAVYAAERLRDWLKRRQFTLPRYLQHPERTLLSAMLAATVVMWLIYNPLVYLPAPWNVYGWEAGAHVEALREVEQLIPPQACVVGANEVSAHYSTRPQVYVAGIRGDHDGCDYMILDLSDARFNIQFSVEEELACTQYWAGKRTPIYFRDTVVVLQQNPAQANPDALRDFNSYCGAYADMLRRNASGR